LRWWRRLSAGEQLVGVSGILLLVVSFLPWLGGRISSLTIQGKTFSTSQYHFTHSAWGYGVTFLALIFGLMALSAVALKAAGVPLTGWPLGLTEGRVLVTLGGIAFVFVLIKVLVGAGVNLASFSLPSTSGLALQITFVKTRQFGSYAGVLTTGGLALGGALVLRDERDAVTRPRR
jgi:hypothetical protein